MHLIIRKIGTLFFGNTAFYEKLIMMFDKLSRMVSIGDIYSYPLLAGIIFVPIFILIFYGNKSCSLKLIRLLSITKKQYIFRFHYVNVLLIAETFAIFVTAVATPIAVSQNYSQYKRNEILAFIASSQLVYISLLIISLILIPFWYKNGSKIIGIFFIFFVIITINFKSFWWPYFYATVVVSRYFRKIYPENPSRKNELFYAITTTLLIPVGVIVFLVFEYAMYVAGMG